MSQIPNLILQQYGVSSFSAAPDKMNHFPSEIQPLSETIIDYTQLRNLLSRGMWKEADRETARIMLEIGDREHKGYLDIEDIEIFPAFDLRTIDQLWVKYSQGLFGFSVQKRIWEESGGDPPSDNFLKCKFGQRVGWYINEHWLLWEELNFSLNAPQGHLPSSPLGGSCLVCDGCCSMIARKLESFHIYSAFPLDKLSHTNPVSSRKRSYI